ncbi:hypothetical protein SADUNF_Sadunf04G0060800 [Salix dunnii]|uniref:Uncharacterized protein n=1 Tax=Salix dunnii TaxID=1413687 RepID=A0A835K751_9ROSI|nr:hypothetical protein SADUNF_Sadunf04G0060800 [Salix dunnii]
MGIDPNNHRLNQILPRPRAEHAAPVMATSTSTVSKNNVSATKPKKLSNGDSTDRVSDTATCLEDENESLVTQQAATSGSSSIHIDLNIAAPASPVHSTTFENKHVNCKWGKTNNTVVTDPSPLPTLLLFR